MLHNTLQGQRVLVLGLGEAGLAVARWVLDQGGLPTVVDTRPEAPGWQALQVNLQQACEGLPSHCQTLHADVDHLPWPFDRMVISPGLPPHHPVVMRAVELAAQHHCQLDSELDLFADALLKLQETQNYAPKVVEITGTNGKTTTTCMVRNLCQHAGCTAVAAGNIGPAVLDALMQALHNNALPMVWVLELSSFQLQRSQRLRCHAAVVLNISQDHLDWHASMAEYAQAKHTIFRDAQVCVLNADDPVVSAYNITPPSKVVWFGLSAPNTPGAFGIVRDAGLQWLAQADHLAEDLSKKSRKANREESCGLKVRQLMPLDALQVRGLHNAANALAALALCTALRLPMAKLLHGLRAYKGEPHRVQAVMLLDDIEYIDDSKGTNVGATVAALQGFVGQQPVVLLAGGVGKGQDFAPLAIAVAAACRAVVLYGQDAPAIALALQHQPVPIHHAQSLPLAVALAHQLAKAGDAVLLSPACASFDMFKNYEHRAQQFVQSVQELALERGQPC
jgi:UDP-N-acetylmuramoylalanine--D-glutamate ligase